MLILDELKIEVDNLQNNYNNHKNRYTMWWSEFISINGGLDNMDNWSIKSKIEYDKRKIEDNEFVAIWFDKMKKIDEAMDLAKHSNPTISNYSYLAKKFGCNKSCKKFCGGSYSNNSHRCKNVGKVDMFEKQSPGCYLLNDINIKIADIFFNNPPCKSCVIQMCCSEVCDELIDYNNNLNLRGKVNGYHPNLKVKINHAIKEFDSSYSDEIFGVNR